MFALADMYRQQGRMEAADALLRALFDDVSPDVRLEAHFRYARALEDRGRTEEAIEQLHAILTERPDAGPVRLELARALAAAGDERRSLREFARLQAGSLPPELAREVDHVVSTLRSTRPFGGSVEVGLAPDSNVNSATRANTITIDSVPFQLEDSARRKPGLGLEVASQIFWKSSLTRTSRLVVDMIGRGSFYRHGEQNDGSLQISVGPELKNRMRPALLIVRRYYGGRGYSWSYGVNWQWLKPISRRGVLDLGVRIERVSVQRSRELDATNYTTSIAVERAIRPTLFLRIAAAAARYNAQSPAFATSTKEARFFLIKDFGELSAYASISYARLKADGRLFGQARRDNRVELSAGTSLRKITVLGASPVFRINHIMNSSTSTLYDTSRTRIEMALSKPF